MNAAAPKVATPELWLAPLRGVTIRAFRETFAAAIGDAGFVGAFAPFIPANPGIRVNGRLFADLEPLPSANGGQNGAKPPLPVIPQVITKHPDAMREFLKGLKDRGFRRADLNAGCPFPMIVRRGRGSGLIRARDMLERLIDVGCEEMGPGRFSVKTRLGLERTDELLELMPVFNRYPLAALTVHARTSKQMYSGDCSMESFAAVCSDSANPVIYNGDAQILVNPINGLKGNNGFSGGVGFSNNGFNGLTALKGLKGLMVGRGFVRSLGERGDSPELLRKYIARSQSELSGDRPVLGRMKELLAYWAEGSPRWRRLWPMVKICRTVDELLSLIPS